MRSICIFVGANSGNNPEYIENARLLGEMLAKNNLRLVYGGANAGLMGALADSVLAHGGQVLGVMPKSLEYQEITHKNLTELVIVDTMQERKKVMIDRSDAFIAMPGGIGTLEELFEVWNSIKIGLYKKPLCILNINGFFNLVTDFLVRAVDEGFAKGEHLEIANFFPDSKLLIDFLMQKLAEESVDDEQIAMTAFRRS